MSLSLNFVDSITGLKGFSLIQYKLPVEMNMLWLLVVMSLLYFQQANCCCLPKQWQVTYGTTYSVNANANGTLQTTEMKWQEYFDGKGKRFRMNQRTGSESRTELLLYNQNVGYSIVNGNCTKIPLGPMPNATVCLSGKSVSPAYLLGYKPDIVVQDYALNDQVIVAMSNHCVPVNVRSTVSNLFVGLTIFGDFSFGIKDPSVFSVPKICKHAPKEVRLVDQPLPFLWTPYN